MKKYLIMYLFLALSALLMANTGTIRLQRGVSTAEILSSDDYKLNVRFAIDAFNYSEVQSKEGVFTLLTAKDFGATTQIGEPKLPVYRKIISVPLGSTPQVRTFNTQQQTILLAEHGIHYPIIPAQESVSKSANTESLPFVINRNFYNGSSSTSHPAVKLEELGMLRGERLFTIDYTPANYNPTTKSIDVVSSTDVEITFIGADLAATAELKAKTFSPAFVSALDTSVWNYQDTRTSLLRYPIGYVIISPQSFVGALQPFIDWKTKEGYDVTVTSIESIGNSYNNIRTYMQGLWNNATPQNPAPSYLLIVGDVAQVATGSSTTQNTHPTDLHYARLQGTDYMPEMYFGRFSATSIAEVTNQVNKTLMHETYSMPDDSYLEDAVLIAGMDSWYAQSHGNGAINYATQRYFNVAHGIDAHTYLYPSSGTSGTQIRSNISSGSGYVNYTAHGGTTEWSDPVFTISHINSLQNQNKYAYVVGNCCLTSKFDVSLSFAEAWLRAQDKGGIIYIGGTNSTYWDEDYWWAVGAKGTANGQAPAYNANALGAYDALFHENNEDFTDWASSAGSMVLMGNLAVVQGGSNLINYYWEIYSIMGDPSLTPYIGIPQENAMQLPERIFLGLSNMELYADPYTWVSLSKDGEIHGVGLTDASGYLNLDYIPFSEPGDVDIVATRSRRRPFVSTIEVIPNEGPYILVSPIIVNDDSGTAEAGETVDIDLTFTNVGILDAGNLTVTMETESPWVYLDSNQTSIDDIASDGTLDVPSIFSLVVDQGTPDQHIAEFSITVSDGEHEWISNRSLTINAPNVVITSVNYFDPNNNGIFEAGENINITLNITNNGHMAVQSGSLRLILNSDDASLPLSNFTIPGISQGVNIPISFNLNIAQDAELGTTIALGIALDMGVQMINHGLVIPVGAIQEGFETGNFSSFAWQNSDSTPWTIVSNERNSGLYSARSGSIGNNSSTSLSVTMDIVGEGNVSFYRRVSSELDYDWLRFYIDNVEMGSWSGNVSWSQVTYPVALGSRTFTWTYEKDISMSGGSDTAWIDDIRFPMTGASDLPMAYTTTESIVFNEVVPNSITTQNLILRNLGTSDLSGIITIPNQFNLSNMGQDLPNSYYYVISPGVTRTFKITYEAPSSVPQISDIVLITTNDPDLTEIEIPITVQSSSNENLVNPVITELSGNFPNPFNPETNIKFSLKEAANVKLNIFNLKGQLVKSLLNTPMDAGKHQLVWDGKDNNGSNVSSGIYLYRMEAGNYASTQKMMLMK
ncbi:MAG: C25 family cysteine peptidase [Candidatus Cloacimonetes bacterium]|nr:C25 family cysteine peptidase [Candidatus Cloacimonadota bacterium]